MFLRFFDNYPYVRIDPSVVSYNKFDIFIHTPIIIHPISIPSSKRRSAIRETNDKNIRRNLEDTIFISRKENWSANDILFSSLNTAITIFRARVFDSLLLVSRD